MMLIAEGFWNVIFGAVLFFLSLAIIGIVLIQKEKGGGLSGAFGGSGSIATFGVKTSAVVEKLTWILFVMFVILTFGMAAYTSKTSTVQADKVKTDKIEKAATEKTEENPEIPTSKEEDSTPVTSDESTKDTDE